MKLYSYVVRDDTGFAPNPFWGYCTLACCKPVIRRCAKAENDGDWIIGTGSVLNVGNDKLIYAMRVICKMGFDQYFTDKRFGNKIPSKGFKKECGDNIYYMNADGKWAQTESYHTVKNMNHDLSGECVLISNDFYYFGKCAVHIPERFSKIIKKGPGHKSKFDPDFVSKFIDWLRNKCSTGINGDPYDLQENDISK